uniref:UDP-glucuronosyltransferase n=1 Tax=Lissorhoptrus oryzophilus TaxID=308863 RepID=A0A2R4FXK5_9CUCU|nr:UDP-glucuronosyltransferase 40AA1 [Lissorhoptrus oryzophilus]
MNVHIIIAFLICLFFLQNTESAKILGLFPLAGRSVYILYNKLFKALADVGHNVTIVSPLKNKLPILNGSYTEVHLDGFETYYNSLLKEIGDSMKTGDSNIMPEKSGFFETLHFMEMMFPIFNDTLYHPNFKKFLEKGEKFDLIIYEHFVGSDFLKMFGRIYDCPTIVFTSMGGINSWINEQVGNYLPPSYVPHFFFTKTNMNEELTLYEKIENLIFYLVDFFVKHFMVFPTLNEVIHKYFKSPVDISELYPETSLVLLGSHSSLRQPTPLVPNMVEIGGFHIDPPQKLPKYLQEFLDDAKEGVIYFSMGSHVDSKDFSEQKKQAFLKAFRKLKMKVIWKYEEEDLAGKPSNVLIKKWLPQTDILAHPNVKLFIGHGGYGSMLETVYHGVPTLMIPVFADQHSNANSAVSLGFALKLSYNDERFSEQLLSSLIHELLINPKYREAAKYRSKLFHDRPMKPLDYAIYWIEYVIRHKGAKHLQVAGARLPWYKFFMLDVLSFLIFVLFLSIFSILYLFRKICCSSGKKLKKD